MRFNVNEQKTDRRRGYYHAFYLSAGYYDARDHAHMVYRAHDPTIGHYSAS